MARKLTLFSGLVIFVLGLIAAGLFNMGLAYTNRMEFCTSCHSMQTNLREYQETIHYRNASGVRATCHDCHVPHDFLPMVKAKVLAAKDVWGKLTGKLDMPEKYEAHRWEMANAVWKKMKASDLATCRRCHDFKAMDFSEQDRSARKRRAKLIRASGKHQPEAVRLLIRAGADVDAQDEDGIRALMEAVSARDLDTVRVLMRHGADALVRNKEGRTAIDRGRKCRDSQCVEVLTGEE